MECRRGWKVTWALKVQVRKKRKLKKTKFEESKKRSRQDSNLRGETPMDF